MVALAVVIGVALSLRSSPSARHNGDHAPSAGPSSPVTTPASTPASPAGAIERLRTIMNPPGLAPVGTDCVKGFLFGLKAATIKSRIFCPTTTVNGIVVWGYQFINHSDYLTGLAHMNDFTGFQSQRASSSCPPISGSRYGLTGWHANSNPRYVARAGQQIECFLDNHQPLLVWTMPTQNTFFIGQDQAKHGATISKIMNWWKTLDYG